MQYKKYKFFTRAAVLFITLVIIGSMGANAMTVSNHTNAVLPSSSLSRSLNGAITLDYKTDIVMYSSNVSRQVQINGGIARLMAVYTAYNIVRNNASVEYSLTEKDMEEYSIRMLFGHSSKDAAVRLATGISGSVPEFVKLMNDTAKTLGMNDTVYTNCTGDSDINQVSSLHDQMLLFTECYELEEVRMFMEGNLFYLDDTQSYSRNIPILDKDNKTYYDSRVTHYLASDYSQEGYLAFSVSTLTQSNASSRIVLSIVYETGAGDFGSGMSDIRILNNNSYNDYYWVILTDLAKRVCGEVTFDIGNGKVAKCAVELKNGDDGITTMSKDYYSILVEQTSKCMVKRVSEETDFEVKANDILSEAQLCYGNDILLTFDLRVVSVMTKGGGIISSADYNLYNPDNYVDQVEAQFNKLEFLPYSIIVIICAFVAIFLTKIMRKKWMI